MNSDKIKVSWDDIQTSSKPQKTVISLDDCREPVFKPTDKISPSTVIEKPSFQKKWLLIPAIIVGVFIFCFLFVSVNGTRYQRPIESVLQQDKNIPQSIQANSAVEAVSTIVQRMRSIDLSECPEDFQLAYQKHTEAWAKGIPVLRKAEELNGFGNMLKSFVVGLIGGYTGQFHLVTGNIMENAYASDELKKAAERVDSEIKTTYYQVLRLAQKYKVNTAPYSN